MYIPFIFGATRVSNNNNIEIYKYVVVMASYDWVSYKMNWERVGNYCSIPDVDLIKDDIINSGVFEFDNERDALLKMKELWAQVNI